MVFSFIGRTGILSNKKEDEQNDMTEMKIISKVKKLLALANSPNVHEAAAAAAKAQELIDQHDINEMMLLDEEETVEDNTTIVEQEIYAFGKRNAAWWSRLLVANVARHNGCYAYRSHDNVGQSVMIGCGPVEKLEAVKMISAWLIGEVIRLLKEENKSYGRAWCNSFRRGAVNKIGKRLKAARRETRKKMREIATSKEKVGTETNALMRLDSALVKVDQVLEIATMWAKQNVFGLRNQSPGYLNNAAGYSAGREAGRRANLSGPKGLIG